jgi:predicted PurR-regulated permease PerM
MRLALTFAISEVALIGLAQSNIIPSDLISIFIQLPLIGLFAWYVLKKDRDTREWIDHLMEEQEKRYNRTIDLFEKIIDRQDNRQADLITTLALLEKTLTLNTATVSESMRLGELIDELKKNL